MLDDIRVQKMCLINKVYSVFVPQEMLYVYLPIRVGLAGQLGLAFDEVVDIINKSEVKGCGSTIVRFGNCQT